MYSPWQLALHYIKYFLSSAYGKGHGIHSAFIFHFISKVLNDKNQYPAYEIVESLRSKLLHNDQKLMVEDFGAGTSGIRTIQAIAKNSAKPKKFGQLLFRMAREYQPSTILELGTSLGITTSYLSLSQPGSKVFTIEGSKEIAGIAKKNFNDLGLSNVTLTEGNFDEKLSSILLPLSTVDFAFLDGNHRREPTERYFHQLLAKINNDSILVFDDIHWSREMQQAWEAIKNHESVRCTIDLFFIGIVFFRKEFREKQHFRIRF